MITGAMNDIVQPMTCEIQSDSAVPNASRRIRVLATLARVGATACGVALIGIGQDAAYANVHRAQRVEEPVVGRIDHRRYLRTDFQSAHLLR